MTQDTPQMAAARIEAERRRRSIVETLHVIQERLNPKRIANDAWSGAKTKGADLAEDAVDAVRKRPVAAGGVVAAVALYLARNPLMDLAGKLVGRNGDADEYDYDDTYDELRRQDPEGVVIVEEVELIRTETVE